MLSLLLALTLDASAQTPAATNMQRMGPVSAEHTGGNFGMGIAVGRPTGVTGKLWLEDWTAVQFSVGGALWPVQRHRCDRRLPVPVPSV